nr:uncharacterized protein CTRU02_10319 [Colletotrichum truncatum]KAF6787522.1 hypothetical protein CTRU02_10319 [Colletotrichum truncatum]
MTEYSTNAQPHFSLLRIIGGWGNVNSMLRSMLAGTSAAAVVGLTASFIGASIWGTAGLPFIIGSTLGFALGSAKWYIAATQESLLQLDKYPSILRLHLISNFPWKPELGRRGIDWFTASRFSSSWQMKSMLIASWLTAQPALDEIRNRTEAELVDAYSRQRVIERSRLDEKDGEGEGSTHE